MPFGGGKICGTFSTVEEALAMFRAVSVRKSIVATKKGSEPQKRVTKPCVVCGAGRDRCEWRPR